MITRLFIMLLEIDDRHSLLCETVYDAFDHLNCGEDQSTSDEEIPDNKYSLDQFDKFVLNGLSNDMIESTSLCTEKLEPFSDDSQLKNVLDSMLKIEFEEEFNEFARTKLYDVQSGNIVREYLKEWGVKKKGLYLLDKRETVRLFNKKSKSTFKDPKWYYSRFTFACTKCDFKVTLSLDNFVDKLKFHMKGLSQYRVTNSFDLSMIGEKCVDKHLTSF